MFFFESVVSEKVDIKVSIKVSIAIPKRERRKIILQITHGLRD